jgi:membrane-associated phospholipid phosphatase
VLVRVECWEDFTTSLPFRTSLKAEFMQRSLMLKVSERALAACKSVDKHLAMPESSWELKKDRLQRILLWVLFSLVVLTLAFLADKPVERAFALQSSSVWHDLAIYSSKAGEGWVVALVGAVGSLCLFFGRRFQASRILLLVASTGLLTGATATVIRSLVGRTRPDSQELPGFYGVWHDSHWTIGKYEFGAFPSGHIATVIGLAAAAWLIDRRLGILAGLYAILVTWSRIALNCHHFSDAVAAAMIGIYGAHMVLAWLGPVILSVVQHLQEAWIARKDKLGAPTNGLGSA